MTISFPKNERFEFVSMLGEGGTGVVYAAIDRNSRKKVALKMLSAGDAQAAYNLKNEFRSLQGLRHKNLVSYYELLEIDGQWYLVMEFVDGVDFIRYVRVSDSQGGYTGGVGGKPGRTKGFDESRLRDGFRQLSEGLSELHETGRVHRDIKPSNVLVDRKGRVVLMDFGVALNSDAACLSAEHSGPVGTAAYMAPEQASTERVGPGADWYSVGVMLYEALTDRLPFDGTAYEIINAKHSDVPTRPQSLAPETPEDLDELCMRLLHRDPGRRPDAAIVLSVLKGFGAGRKELDAALLKTKTPVFAGRGKELEFLYEKFKRSANGGKAVLLHGESGVGKTTLLGAFSRRVSADTEEAAVLYGSCSRTEPVCFNAFDGVVNDLERFLKKLGKKEVLSLVPSEASALLRVFPVLSRVEVLNAESTKRRFSEDVQMVRTLAFDTLRDLLTRLAEKRRVLLIIDDFQWADRDSIRLLRALFQPPEIPSVCLVLCLCTSTDPAKVLNEIENTGWHVPVDLIEMKVEPLPAEAAVNAARMLFMEGVENDQSADRLAGRSGGRPLLLQQLVRYVEEGGGEGEEDTLEDVLEARTAGLETQTRELLELVCIAGEPIGYYTVSSILEEEETAKISRRVAQLRWMDLLRTAGPKREDLFEPYHDLVCRWVIRKMDPAKRERLHGLLFRALKVESGVSRERLAMHLEAAGDERRAALLNLEAAREAAKMFAFDRAAAQYRKALENLPGPETLEEVDEMRRLMIRLAEALVLSGRRREAAKVYLKALKGANAAEQLRLEHLAASQLLMSGMLDHGLDIIDNVAKRLGVRLPRTPWRTLLSFLLRRIHIRIRGLRFSLKDPSQVTPEELERVDLWRSVAVGLGVSDNMHAADFNTRWIMKALEVGEPDRVMQALALESAFVASLGKRGTRYFTRLSNNVNVLLNERDSKVVQAYLGAGRGYGAFMAGEWRSAGEAFEMAERLMLDSSDMDCELAAVRFVILWSKFYLGELDEMARRLMPMVRMAMDRGDIFAASGMFLGLTNIAYLNRDGPEAARREVDEMISRWSTKRYHLQHYWALLARVHIALFTGSGSEARDLVETDMPALKKSLLLLMPAVANEGAHLRARAILAAASESETAKSKKLISQVKMITRRLGRKKLGWMKALSLLLDGAIHVHQEDIGGAIERLRLAVRGLDEQEMKLYAAAARWRLAEIVGGDEGRENRKAAEDFMNGQKINNPEGMVNLLAPGFPCDSGEMD